MRLRHEFDLIVGNLRPCPWWLWPIVKRKRKKMIAWKCRYGYRDLRQGQDHTIKWLDELAT